MATIKDVAKLAGVSISTVSIVINGKAEERKVAAKTYNKVMDAIKTLDYKPNLVARRLKSSDDYNKPVIALYWPLDYRTTFLARILLGLQYEIKRLNFDSEIVVCTYENNKLFIESDLNSKHKFNAAIIGATSAEDMKYLETLESPIPIVLFNRQLDKFSSVCYDNDFLASKIATLFLAKGHKHVAIITTQSPHPAMSKRINYFINACLSLGIEVDEKFIIRTENSYEGGAIAASILLNTENRPKALFCDSDFLALGASYIFNREKVRVPQDIEIVAVGMSDPSITEYSIPPITVASIPTIEMASYCINIIHGILNNKITKPINKVFEPKLLLRDSCRP